MKVYTYESIERPSRHCREELAVDRFFWDREQPIEPNVPLVLFDTFWGGGSETHRLTDAELATAVLVFDTDDYDMLPRYPRDSAHRTWLQYRPEDRKTVTSQHGLQNDYYVRKGSKPDLLTKIENARAHLESRESKLRQATWGVESAQRDLDELLAEADSSGLTVQATQVVEPMDGEL